MCQTLHKMLNLSYISTLPSVNHASNLVQFFNPNQSITSSLYLSCVKVGSGPNGSLGRIIYHFFPVRHTPSLSQPRLSTQDFYVSCFSSLLYLIKFFNFLIDFTHNSGSSMSNTKWLHPQAIDIKNRTPNWGKRHNTVLYFRLQRYIIHLNGYIYI